MDPRIAVVADGRLDVIDTGGLKTRHTSDFGEGIENRAARLAEKSAWKNSGGGGILGGESKWGSQAEAPPMKPRISAVFPGLENQKFGYVLTTESIGAFLEYDLQTGFERRIFHKESFFVSSVDRHPDSGELICQCGSGEFVSQIAKMNPEGRDLVPLTEGDAVDAAPVWDRANPGFIYYHSAGVAYDPKGNLRGVGPHEILRLDLEKGRLTTVLEEETTDHICPRSDAEGNLYFIRRPYEGPRGPKVPLWTTIKDTLLFPFRLLRSLFDFFQIFSMLVSKKPLTTGGRSSVNGPEPLAVWIHGRMLSQDKEASDGALAPPDWKLIRRYSQGKEEVLASKVLAFDVSKTAEIIYSDGRNIYEIVKGKPKLITKIALTSEVRWL